MGELPEVPDLLTEEDEVFLPNDVEDGDVGEVDEVVGAEEVEDDEPPLVAPRTVVFTTLSLLSLLCIASHIHVDGTFKVYIINKHFRELLN